MKRKFKIFFGALLFFLILLKSNSSCLAYFSPQTLLLVKLGFASFFWQFLAGLLILLVAWFLKFKKVIKKYYWFLIPLLSLIIITGFFVNRVYFLKKSNEVGPIIPTTPELSAFYSADEKKLIEIVKRQVGEIPRKNYLSYQDFTEKHFLDLEKIDSNDLRDYKILGAFASWDIRLKNQAGELPVTEILADAEKAIIKYNTNKEKDKVLIYCYHGLFTSKLAYIYYLLGYDTYFSGIKDLKNPDIIDTKKILETASENVIVMDKLADFDKNTDYKLLIFGFSLDYDYDKPLYENKDINLEVLILDSKSPTGRSSVDEFEMLQAPNVVALPKEELKLRLEENYKKTKIICTSDLNCLFTQHFLYNVGLAKKFPVIYQSCLVDAAGRTRCK